MKHEITACAIYLTLFIAPYSIALYRESTVKTLIVVNLAGNLLGTLLSDAYLDWSLGTRRVRTRAVPVLIGALTAAWTVFLGVLLEFRPAALAMTIACGLLVGGIAAYASYAHRCGHASKRR